MGARGKPELVDRQVGAKVRMRRMELGLSQEKLGEQIDLTFQQIQKYEKGTNRISAARLAQIAQVLNVPVSWFFGADAKGVETPETAVMAQMLSNRRGIELAQAFVAIADPKDQALVVSLANRLRG